MWLRDPRVRQEIVENEGEACIYALAMAARACIIDSSLDDCGDEVDTEQQGLHDEQPAPEPERLLSSAIIMQLQTEDSV